MRASRLSRPPRRLFAPVDCENFYCSCERVFRPDLARVPVAVLSNNDGCVIARSEEVKALGVRLGEPFFKVRERLEKESVAVFSSNYELYADVSRGSWTRSGRSRPTSRSTASTRRSSPSPRLGRASASTGG